MYLGLPNASRWYDVADPARRSAPGADLPQERDGVGASDFRKHINSELAPALIEHRRPEELRTQTFLPWIEKLWDTPNVAHDNPADQRFHASLILGFPDAEARAAFFASLELEIVFLPAGTVCVRHPRL
jgi:hypothetical protein